MYGFCYSPKGKWMLKEKQDKTIASPLSIAPSLPFPPPWAMTDKLRLMHVVTLECKVTLCNTTGKNIMWY